MVNNLELLVLLLLGFLVAFKSEMSWCFEISADQQAVGIIYLNYVFYCFLSISIYFILRETILFKGLCSEEFSCICTVV